jgi:ATP-dependent Lhr-like helicase
MNLAGIVIPGDRVPAVPGKQVLYRNGNLHTEDGTVAASSGSTDLLPAMLSTPSPTGLGLRAPTGLGLFQ